MNIDILLIILVAFSFLWLILHIKERRRIINGIVFFISLMSLVFLMIYIGSTYSIDILNVLSGLIILLVIILIPILFITVVTIMFTSGYKLLKREGVSLSHLLSFIMGLGIVGSVFIAPIFMNRIESRMLKAIIVFFLSVFSYFSLGFIFFYTSSIIYKLHYTRRNRDYLIVLGSGLIEDKVTPLLAGRIDEAIKFYNNQIEKNGKVPIIVMSGGQGPDELVPEAIAMRNYAIEQGVAEKHIICEDQSKSTEENLKFSMNLINSIDKKEKKNISFFTSNYHVFRAALISKNLDYNMSGIGARVKLYFYVSAIIREYIAVLVMNKDINIVLCMLLGILNIIGMVN